MVSTGKTRKKIIRNNMKLGSIASEANITDQKNTECYFSHTYVPFNNLNFNLAYDTIYKKGNLYIFL